MAFTAFMSHSAPRYEEAYCPPPGGMYGRRTQVQYYANCKSCGTYVQEQTLIENLCEKCRSIKFKAKRNRKLLYAAIFFVISALMIQFNIPYRFPFYFLFFWNIFSAFDRNVQNMIK